MLLVFYRHITPEGRVVAKANMSHEGKVETVGLLRFTTKLTWSKFYGAITKGALQISDLEVSMENAKDDPSKPASPPPTPPAGQK